MALYRASLDDEDAAQFLSEQERAEVKAQRRRANADRLFGQMGVG